MSQPSAREAELLRRVAELEGELERQEDAARRLRDLEERMRGVFQAARDGIGITQDGIVIEVNQRFAELFGYSVEEMVGKHPSVFHPPEHREEVRQKIQSNDEQPYEVPCLRKDGTTFIGEVCGRTILVGSRKARVTALRDITAARREEEARQRALFQEEVIRQQEALLAELAAPVLPIARGVLVVPLVGALNEQRGQRVIDALGREVASRGARVAILDITGVPEVNQHVGEGFLRAARMVQLLGAQVIVTGIRPEVARRLVELDADLGGVITCGTLEQGVARALARA